MVEVVFGLSRQLAARIVVVFVAHSIFCGTEEALEGLDWCVRAGVEHWQDRIYEDRHEVLYGHGNCVSW